MSRPALCACLTLCAFLAGCVTPKYHLESSRTPPQLLNHAVTQGSIDAVLNTVIVYHGPGTWKRDAFWDEYVVSVVNRSSAPVTLEYATLTNFRSEPSMAGNTPWPLERQSFAVRDKANRGTNVAVVEFGAGADLIRTRGEDTAQKIAAGTVNTAFGIATLYVGYAAVAGLTNVARRNAVEEEFEKRRLKLPLSIAPGQTVQGSLFFPISPGPQRLTLRVRADAGTIEPAFELLPLAALHLKNAAPPLAR